MLRNTPVKGKREFNSTISEIVNSFSILDTEAGNGINIIITHRMPRSGNALKFGSEDVPDFQSCTPAELFPV